MSERPGRLVILITRVLCLLVIQARAADLGTAFTYQGNLEQPAGTPVTGVSCDFEFSLWDDPFSGLPANKVGTTLPKPGVPVTAGAFTVPLDFGADAIKGQGRWLDIKVCCPNSCAVEQLSPRVALTPSPQALALPGLYTQQNVFSPNLIGGRFDNSVTVGVAGATIAGGGAPIPDINRITDTFGAVGGGCTNRAGNDNASPSDAQFATVAGGFTNTASQPYSSVGGGTGNSAAGDYATVPGGRNNRAGGAYSFAAGRSARVRIPAEVGGGDIDGDEGTFVWADSTGANFTSAGANQFLIRASGGVGIGTTAPGHPLQVGVPLSGTGGNGAHVTSGGVWTDTSSREVKENFAATDARGVLDKVAALPIATWNYKNQDRSIRHVGPVAEDFHALFETGQNQKFLAALDTAGVALAAIQGLYEIVKERDCEIDDLKAKAASVEQLEAKLASLEAQVTSLTMQATGGGR